MATPEAAQSSSTQSSEKVEEQISCEKLTHVSELNESLVGKNLKVRGFLHIKRETKKMMFYVIRQAKYTFQVAVLKSKDKPQEDITVESSIEVCGTLQKAMQPIKSCTQQDVEMFNPTVKVVSESATPLPIQINQLFGGEGIKKGPDGRFENAPELATSLKFRPLDLRTLANWAIFRIKAGVSRLFREFLTERKFIEIHTPKICPGKSEGGANCFELQYFDDKATLAQSPQLYKQMCICGGMEKVFEVAPAFRAEKSNTPRHLCEFISMDFEMELSEFKELPIFTLQLFKYMFDGLNAQYKDEIEAIKQQYPVAPIVYDSTPVLVQFDEACKWINESQSKIVQSPTEDIGTEAERILGKIVKEKFNTDIYCLVGFPQSARPFYTHPDPERPGYSLSFDVELRGEEIVSGAQRINSSSLLEQRGKELDIEIPKEYVDAFRFGAPPHGGVGIGLERVTMFFLGLTSIREACLFPRFYGGAL
ncbi:putative Aspartate-tRNA ligase [Monocercomonoides exilis]|uniref:putative Aspartate-tRNA ligase n=1 Tax=Monocercomonoides exilis TaxID=2049356 RepID=UPI00355AA4C5|nr:putative Aspartate-tRNA ligase [Monocercomonoides exilis]